MQSKDNHKAKKSLIRLAKEGITSENPTMLGDPVSLKAEASDSHPTENDRGATPVKPEIKGTTTRQTPSGIGKSKVVGGTHPPSTLNMPPLDEERGAIGDPIGLKAVTSVVSEQDLGKEEGDRKKSKL